MKLLLACVFVASVLLPAAGQAQHMYRCGNTYSQVPCSPEAPPIRLGRSAPPDAGGGARGAALCSASAPTLLRFTDPESARIESAVKASTEIIQYAGQSVAARKYILSINVKNTSGGYVGAANYACFLSEDERRILKMGAAQ